MEFTFNYGFFILTSFRLPILQIIKKGRNWGIEKHKVNKVNGNRITTTDVLGEGQKDEKKCTKA